MKKEILIIAVIIISGCTNVTPEKPGDNADITRIVDGDTLEADVRGETVTIRLQGVDTPEVHAENTPEDWKCSPSKQHLREYGEKASSFVKENYNNTKARIVYRGTGTYDRTLASIHVNGTNMEKQLLRKGLAQTYENTEFGEKSRFQQIESKARREEKGVWSVC